MKEHYIDSRFREELAGLEANPPVEAWMAITDALDVKRKKHTKFTLFKTAAALAFLLVATFSFWFVALNEQTPVNEFQIGQAMPVPMQALNFDSFSSSGTRISALNKKQINQHSHSLVASAREDNEHAFRANNTSIAYIPTPGIAALITHMPDVQIPVPASQSKSVITTNHYNYQVDLAASVATARSKKSSISLGIHMAPQYNYRYLTQTSQSLYDDIPFQSLEQQIYSYSAGLSAHVRLSPNWAIQTGLNYNNTGQFIQGIVSYHHPDNISLYSDFQYVLTSLGGVRVHDTYNHFEDIQSTRILTARSMSFNADVDKLNKTTEGITQTFSYIEIPLVLRYHIYRQHIGLEVKGGFSGNYLVRKDVFLGKNMFQSPIGETLGVEQFNFSVIGGFALNLPITSNIMLHVEPTAQLFLHPVVIDGLRVSNAVPYNLSLHTGFSYRF